MKFTSRHQLVGKTILALTFTLCAKSAVYAQAPQTTTWTGAQNAQGFWDKPGNWTPGVPDGSTIAQFGTATVSPSLNSPGSALGVTFLSGASAFTFGGTSTLTVGAEGIDNQSTTLQTINNPLSLSGAQTWSLVGNITVGAAIGGTGPLTKDGAGTLRLERGNTFTGATVINGGTLSAASADALLGTSSIQVNNGGTLLFAGNNGITNRINNSAELKLAGGTLNLAGSTEAESSSAGIGTLTLTANSTIDFGLTPTGQTNTILWFDGASYSGGTLTIQNWTVGGVDQLRFTNNAGLTPAFLSQVTFSGYGQGAQVVQQNGYYEMRPIPEPSTIIAGIGLVGFLGWRERRRISSLFKRQQNEEVFATA